MKISCCSLETVENRQVQLTATWKYLTQSQMYFKESENNVIFKQLGENANIRIFLTFFQTSKYLNNFATAIENKNSIFSLPILT